MAEVSAQAPELAKDPPSGGQGQSATIPVTGKVNTEVADPTKKTNAVQAVGAPFRIKPLAGGSPWLKALIYGKHGAGKTELAGSAVDVPEMRDVLFISAESGEKTLENSERIKNAQQIMTITAQDFKQIGYIHDFLVAHCKHRDTDNVEALRILESKVTERPPAEITTPKRFRTVIMDSLTEMEAYSMYSLLGVDASKTMINEEMEVADWPIFRKNYEMVKLLCRSFRNLPLHIIFVCSQQYSQDEMKRFHYVPQLTGKLAGAVQGQVDMVGWLITGSPTQEKPMPRRLYVQPILEPTLPRFDAKLRNATYKQAFFDDPLMADIMQGLGLLKK